MGNEYFKHQNYEDIYVLMARVWWGKWRDTKHKNKNWYHHTDFQSGYTSLHSHQQWRSVRSPYSYPLQHNLSLVLLILVILTGLRWYRRVILFCISMMAKNVAISISVFQPFDTLLLRILCLDLYPIFNWIIWYIDI